MPLFRTFALPVLCLSLLGCGGDPWETSYTDDVSRFTEVQSWGYGGVEILLDQSLSVSEANSFAPNAAIVWQEEEYGDRRKQVGKILFDAISKAAHALPGSNPVAIRINVHEFHALTRKARYNAPSGVHNITFTAQVIDRRTGVALSEPERIRADLPAFTGDEALRAEARGITQKSRISAHLEAVMKGWLGVGPDMRGTFGGFGR